MASYSKRTKIDPATGKEIILYWRIQDIINGERKEFTGKTKKIAEQKLNDYKADIEQYGIELCKDSYSFSEWTYNHLFTIKIHQISTGTFTLYTMLYNKYIKPSTLGKTQIKEITQLQVQAFLNSLSHLSHSSLKNLFIVISGSFDTAIKNNLMRINPARGCVIPNKKARQKEIAVLTKAQQRDYILATEKEPYRLLFLTALFTGLRQGELAALRWQNLNLNLGIIYVCENLRRYIAYNPDGSSESKIITKGPKSRSGQREVPLPNFLIDEFKKIKPPVKDSELADKYVFETPKGTPVPSRTIHDIHKRLCKHAKINPVQTTVNGKIETQYKGIHFHALRHTFTTRMIESGESIKTVQAILGHADIQTTMNIYAHVLNETKKASADKQNALFTELMG